MGPWRSRSQTTDAADVIFGPGEFCITEAEKHLVREGVRIMRAIAVKPVMSKEEFLRRIEPAVQYARSQPAWMRGTSENRRPRGEAASTAEGTQPARTSSDNRES